MTRKFLVLFAILLSSVCLYASGCSTPQGNSNMLGAVDNVYQLDTSLPEVPCKVPVFRVIQKEVNEEYVIEIGKKFGLSGTPEPHYVDGELYYYLLENETTSEEIEVYAGTGAFMYGYDELGGLYIPDAVLPDNETAKQLAFDYLNEHGLLMKEATVVDEVGPGGSYGGPNGETIVTHLIVRFTYDIGSLPVVGYRVRVGDKGRIFQVGVHLIDHEVYEEAIAIKAAEQAYQDLQDDKGINKPITSGDHKLVVKKVKLEYGIESLRERQEYLYPVYRFDMEYYDRNGNYECDFTEWVDARMEY